ncbi:MAG: AAA family ATPase [Bacteroidetes bacterium]|nr:AAA family ATPase [Bacteroidota bacterium]
MQKQEATILSIELLGFQDYAENTSPEQVQSLMDKIYHLLDNTVRLHHGAISRYTGETLLSVYSNSKISKTSSLHAIDSALEITDQLISLNREHQLEPPIRLKTGIATGSIMTTAIGSDDKKQTTLMGDAVNHANRICQFAEEGQILADEKTLEGLRNDFELQKLEPIPLKGGVETLPIFELAGKKRKKLDLKPKSERKIISEMVGRSQEAEQLEGLIRNLIAGKGSIVNIVGKAGIGKSRLLEELKVQPIMEKVLLLEGRAVSTGQNLSFHPITNLIKNWAGITEDDLPSASSEKLYQGIKRNTSEQADEIYAFMATMMGLPLEGKYKERVKGIEGEALEKLILKNLRDLIIAATKDKPRIYMVEDMHWADSSSITLFESLYKLSQNHPVMFINVMRPGYKETGDYILKYLVDNFPGDHNTINVNPLEEKESGNLIKNLLREASLPDEIQKMIIRKTEGNPFFIEEIIRSFIDEGIIEIKDGHFVVTDKIKEVNIPETINEAILSRVDKLDEKTRELLNTASVMGRNFYYKVLEEATDTIEELDERLSYLTEVQLISETKKKQEIEYLFKHALAQQLTYDAMMQQSRKDTHLKIARSIEKVFAANISEYYSTLAYHYEKAENNEKTQEYLLKAGDEAIRSGASLEALKFYEKAHEMILGDNNQNLSKEQMLDLEMRIADLYRACGENQEAADRFKKLMETFTNHRFSKNEKLAQFRAAFSLLLTYIMVHNHKLFFKKEMNPEIEKLMKMTYGFGTSLISMNPKQFAIDTLPIVKKICYYNFIDSVPSLRIFCVGSSNFGMTGLSLNTSQKMIEISEKAGIEKDVFGKIGFRMLNKMQNYYSGRWHNQEDEQSVINQGLRAGSFWDIHTYMTYCGLNYIEAGEYKKTIEMQNLLHEQAENYNSGYAVSMAYRLQACSFYKFRKFDEFLKIAGDGAQYIGSTENLALSLVFISMQSLVYLNLGDIAKAEIALNMASEIQKKASNIPVYHTPYLLAKVNFDLEKLQRQNENSKEYKALLNEIKHNSKTLIAKSKKLIANLPEAYLSRARFYFAQKKYSSAFKNIQLAITTCEKYNSRLELSRAYFETGKFLSDPKNKYNELNGHNASHYLEKAKAMFEEMDLQWDLEEYEKFVSEKTIS